jgi:hypothetical protein
MSLAYPPHHRDLFQETGDGRFVVDEQWHDFFRALVDVLNGNASATIVLAKTTPGGTNGSLEITNGIVTQVTSPT